MGDVQDGTILHAGPGTHRDGVHIAADRHLRPNRNIIAQRNITQDDRAGINEYARAQLGGVSAEAAQAGGGVVVHKSHRSLIVGWYNSITGGPDQSGKVRE